MLVVLPAGGKPRSRLKMSAPHDNAPFDIGSSRNPQSRPVWKPRRYHNKSRSGCLSCKRRRIKCGEERPECRNCWEKAMDCVYPTATTTTASRSQEQLHPPETSRSPASSWTTLSKSYTLPSPGQDDARADTSLSATKSEPMKSDVERLMDHFVTHISEAWIGSSMVQQVMQQSIMEASTSRPYLLHTALALSAAHISHTLSPDKRFKYLSALHYQFALEEYCRYLRQGIDAEDTDAMFSTCTLLAMLTFSHLVERGPSPSVDENNPSRIWVRAMQGTKFLLESPQYYSVLRTGIWADVVREYDDFDEATAAKYLDPSVRAAEDLSLIVRLESACKSEDENEQEIFSAGIFMLKDLARLLPTTDVIGRFAFTLTRLPHNFYGLVDRGDVRALTIVGFWCALISRIQSWWVTEPAKVECRRIADEIAVHDDARYSELTAFLRGCAG